MLDAKHGGVSRGRTRTGGCFCPPSWPWPSTKEATMTLATPTVGRQPDRAAAIASDLVTAAGRWSGLSALARLAARFADYRLKQRMIAELEALDDRHLKDIGIVRGEIWHRVYHRDQYDRMPGTAARSAAAIHQVVTKRLI